MPDSMADCREMKKLRLLFGTTFSLNCFIAISSLRFVIYRLLGELLAVRTSFLRART
jgi:hypothetical protein